MIHPVSLVQAGMILVTVCIIQTVGTKPENEYTVTGKLSTREVEVTLQVMPCGSFFRQDTGQASVKVLNSHGNQSGSGNPRSPVMPPLPPVEEETHNQSPNSEPIQISADATNTPGTSSHTYGNN